ncbi:PREDICTED: protein eva-1 homolog C-like isoform X2 [Papilio polytes]|uniref:protein eva-1 homolog C-like isoform X2 n=1 Tax=Papilio polytes TaxID=76194 RepID=UPI000675FFE6|nr:PREDICTED: protein eva-1 homolog C-like isoform X2 [Papilio polytes]
MFEKLFLLFACLILPRPSYMNPDNIGLLASTLKTMQIAACDDETVSLRCPAGTSISIQFAKYGKAAPQGHKCVMEGLDFGGLGTLDKEVCLLPNSMQYYILQTVVETCQKKPQCTFSTKTKPGTVDPCPSSRKFIEVAYKCKPFEFRSRTGCENDVLAVSCDAHTRIAVLDAQYGRTAFESSKCPQTDGVPDETCKAPHTTETAMQICHGKRRCQISVTQNIFGSPCGPESRPYLKIVYACVPLDVLTEKYESALERDEVTDFLSGVEDNFFGETDEFGEQNGSPSIAVPAPPSSYDNQPTIDVTTIAANKNNDGPLPEATNSKTPKMLIYAAVSILILITLVFVLLVIRYLMKRRTKNNPKTNDMFTTETPNIFGDGLSDIDNDVDLALKLRDVTSA